MKKSLVVLALFLLLKPILPVIEYIVNYDYIATVLCVNKEKPVMKCNGKCYLMKELAKTAEDEKPIADKKFVVKVVEVLFCVPVFTATVPKLFISYTNVFNFAYSNLYGYLNCSNLFHPPSFLV